MSIISKLQDLIEQIENDGLDIGSNYLETLEFYANEDNWKPGGDAFNPTPAPIALDKGERARQALGLTKVKTKNIKGKPEKITTKSKTKKTKNKKVERPQKESRPPIEMIKAKCTCGFEEPLPKSLIMNKLDDSGNLVSNYKCAKCIKNRV